MPTPLLNPMSHRKCEGTAKLTLPLLLPTPPFRAPCTVGIQTSQVSQVTSLSGRQPSHPSACKLISFLQTTVNPQRPRLAIIRIAPGGPTWPDKTPIITTPTGP